jgi:OmpA family
MAAERPSVDLQTYFDFNSAAIAPQAVPQLTNLGYVLAKPELKGSLVTISGHTDAKGSDSYNQIKDCRNDAPRVSSGTWSITSGFRPKTWSLSATDEGCGGSVRPRKSTGPGRQSGFADARPTLDAYVVTRRHSPRHGQNTAMNEIVNLRPDW